MIIAIDFEFQFYDSPIKSISCSFFFLFFLGFNSMIVRLKVALQNFLNIIFAWVFQFYDSPIKSSVLQTLTNQDLAVSIL